MNGIEKKQLQILAGTSFLVESLNDLRIHFGFDSVMVLTPIVETKLRSGIMPLKPLQILLHIPAIQHIRLIFTIPMTYPSVCMEVLLSCGVQAMVNRPEFKELQILCNELCSLKEDEGCTVKDTVLRIMNTLKDEYHRIMLAASTAGFDIENEICMNTSTTLSADDDVLDDAHDVVNVKSDQQEDPDPNLNRVFTHCTCKICGATLFLCNPEVLHEHTASTLQSASASTRCTSLFISCAPEYLNINGEMEGKIYCHNTSKCGARVGSWSWHGIQCSCGEWAVPAFQYIKSKVDLKYG